MRPLAALARFALVLTLVGCGGSSPPSTLPAAPPAQAAAQATGGPAIEPELVVQAGHTQHVQTLAFSPDGQLLASAGSDGVIVLWDVRTRRQLRAISAHSMPIPQLLFTPDGGSVITIGADLRVQRFNVDTGERTGKFEGHVQSVISAALSPDGKWLVTGSVDGLFPLWDVATQKLINTQAYSSAVEAAQFSPDGRLIAAMTGDGILHLIDQPSFKELASIRVFPERQGTKEHPIEIHYNQALAFSPSGKRIAVGTYEGLIHVIDAATGAEVEKIGAHERPVQRVAFMHEDVLVSSAYDKLSVWDLKGKRVSDYDAAYSFAISGDKSLIAAVGPQQPGESELGAQNVILRDGRSFEFLGAFFSPLRVANAEFIVNDVQLYALDFHPSLPRIARSGLDGKLRVWDLTQAKAPRILADHGAWVRKVLYDPKGTRIATCGQERVKLWDAESGAFQREFVANCVSLAFSPDGKRLAIGTGVGDVVEYDVASGARLQSDQLHQPLDRIKLRNGKLESKIPHEHLAGIPEFMAGAGTNSEHDSTTGVLYDDDGERLLSTGAQHGSLVYQDAQGRPERAIEVSPNWANCIARHGNLVAVGWGVHKVMHSMTAFNAPSDIGLIDIRSRKLVRVLKGHSDRVQAVAFSPDGKLLASGAGDGTTQLYDVASGQRLGSYTEQTDVWGVDFSADGRVLASISSDGSVRLYDVNKRAPLATLVSFGEDGYVMATPDNHYSASRAGLSGVAFRMGRSVVPFEQFDLRLNRPDLVLSNIGYADPELIAVYKRAHEKRLERMGFSEAALRPDYALPRLRVTTPPPGTSDLRSVTIKLQAEDAQNDIERIFLYVNDVPVHGANGLALGAKKGRSVDLPLDVVLSSGANKIQLSAVNSAGTESLKETFITQYTGPTQKPRLFVVAVGISEHKDSRLNLRFASKDARDLVDTFRDLGTGFAGVEAVSVLDRHATREEIMKTKQLLMRSTVDDQVVVFFAGHGMLDKKLDYYFVTTDFERKDPARRGLRYEDMESLLDGIPARRKLLLIDTCHSGEVDRAETKIAPPSPGGGAKVSAVSTFRSLSLEVTSTAGAASGVLSELFADLRRGSGAMVISSAGGAEFALESPEWNNGVFTYAVLFGLRGRNADVNHDGSVRVSELRDYVVQRVQTLTGGRQTPTARRENLAFDFAVY